MAKFNLGDIVHYTNKKTNTDVIGEIIGFYKNTYDPSVMIEIFKGRSSNNGVVYTYTNSPSYILNESRFNRILGSSTGLVSKSKNVEWAPYKSKNLRFAFPAKDYDTSQQGDTEDDI